MKTKIAVVLFVVLSVALGGCGGYVTHRTTVVGTVPVYYEPVVRERIVVEAHPTRYGREVSKTTVVEKSTDDGVVVRRTTVVEKSTDDGVVVRRTTVVEKVRTVDCSSRNPYRDEYTPSSPCYWRKHVH